MIHFRTDNEIELLRQAALLVGKTLGEVGKHIRPGVRTIDLDKLAEEFIRDHGATPAFKGYGGFPGRLGISANEQVVHGIPGDYELRDGDIVSVDCGTVLDGYVGDSAYTFPVGKVDARTQQLLDATKQALELGIRQAVAGNRTGDIGEAVQSYCENLGFSVVRELVGHGLGTDMHESPEVPNYGRRGHGVKLREGMVICIEPMINAGRKEVYLDDNGWAVHTADGAKSAHFEKTVAVRHGQPEVLTTYEFIEKGIC